MNNAADHGKKKLHDSIGLIANEDTLRLLLELGKELFHRREMCRAAFEANVSNDLVLAQLKYQNDRIIKLLGI